MSSSQQSIYIGDKHIMLYLLPAKREKNLKANLEIYDQSYFLWKENWNHYFNIEHNDQKTLYSDDFTTHDEILSIFYQGECIANCLFKNFHTNDPTAKDNHYFSIWNDIFLQSIFKNNEQIKICTYFSIKEEYRKNFFDISIKQLLFTSSIKVFLDSPSSVMLATMRTKRAMEKSGVAYGGKIIETDKVHHRHANNQEELVDLILFEREASSKSYQKSPFFSLIETTDHGSIKKAA